MPRKKTDGLKEYNAQRHAAGERGIEWQFTFDEWWAVWKRSGKWSERGRGSGKYVMARHADQGPYSTDNVSIQLGEKNTKDAFSSKPYLARKGRIGGPTGVGGGKAYYRGPNRANPWQVSFRGKYIGCFKTQAEGNEAYDEAAAIYLKSVGMMPASKKKETAT